jgi:FMN phosphatase YigB (HAD superfamily)
VEPHTVVHTGDHWVFDFLNPRKIGINAFYLDRNRGTKEAGKKGGVKVKKEEEFIISDLKEILNVFVR